MSDLKLFKLLSGEDVLAKVKSETDATFEIEDSVLLVMHPTKDGQSMSVGFAPFLPYSEGGIVLQKTALAAVTTPNDQLRSEHLRIFSGIVLASANSM